MITKNTSNAQIMLLSGLFVVIAGFFLLVPALDRTNVFWLNLVVSGLVYLVLAFVLLGFLGLTGAIDRQLAGLGIRISFGGVYAVAALASMILGSFLEYSFKTQLFLQLCAGFLLVAGVVFSGLSLDTGDTIEAERQWKQKGKQTILERLHQLDTLVTQQPDAAGGIKARVDMLKEAIRYISPSNNHSARLLDGEIIDAIHQAYMLTSQGEPDQRAAVSMLDKADELIKVRKKIIN
jgi:hypothetical protein